MRDLYILNNPNLCPNKKQLLFLQLAYPAFYNLFNEITEEHFYEKSCDIRFFKIKNIFAIYNELLNYPPIKYEVEQLQINRPRGDYEIACDLAKFIRNVILHFPFFNNWNEVFITKYLINWDRENLSIDKFIKKYLNKQEINCRIWDTINKEYTYVEIRFPQIYETENKIFLKDLVSEKEGIKLILIMMLQILNSQLSCET